MSSNRNRIGPGLDKKNKTACASLSCRVVCQDWFWRAALLFFILTREGGHSAPLSVSSALTQTDRNRGEGGKERKGKVLPRPDQPRTLQVSINHWTGYLKRISLWSDGDAEWRSVFLKCLLREIFRCFLISGRQIPNAASSHSSRKEVAHICVRTDLQTLLTQSKLHFFCFSFFFLAWL